MYIHIETPFKETRNLNPQLTRKKPEKQLQKSKNCAYKIFNECGRSYVGKTQRPLKISVKKAPEQFDKRQIANCRTMAEWKLLSKLNNITTVVHIQQIGKLTLTKGIYDVNFGLAHAQNF